MDAIHPHLDHGTGLEQLAGAAADLANQVPTLSDDELLDGVMSVVASVSRAGCDAHTGAYIWGANNYVLDSLPLRLWWFDDGIHVVDALDPYRGLIGSRLTSIAGMPIDAVIDRLDPLIPRDNEWTVRLLMPRYLLIPQVLAGVGVPVGSSTQLDLVAPDGATGPVDVEAIPMSEYNAWAGAYGLFLPADQNVLYLSRTGETLWWQTLQGGTLFVQYNQVDFVTPSIIDQLRAALTAPGVRRVVLDLRHNTGGEVRAVDVLVDLFADPLLTRAGRLFVITGRNTFSAAGLLVARLQDQASATVVGEPMSGCPTTWADPDSFELPFSHITVSVSTLLEIGVAADDSRGTIVPDIAAPLNETDWAAGIDPALAAIKTRPRHERRSATRRATDLAAFRGVRRRPGRVRAAARVHARQPIDAGRVRLLQRDLRRRSRSSRPASQHAWVCR